jgi:hypothetical protein
LRPARAQACPQPRAWHGQACVGAGTDSAPRNTEVACSHVSGLFTQSGWTAGLDGVREPRPHHSSGIDVPMKRQASLGCVGAPPRPRRVAPALHRRTHNRRRCSGLRGTPSATRDGSESSIMPMRGIFPGCCARAASGHAAATPPRSDMNSRRSFDHLVGKLPICDRSD